MVVFRDECLTKYVMDQCWHKAVYTIPYHDGEFIGVCDCKKHSDPINFRYETPEKNSFHVFKFKQIDFSTGNGFIDLWNAARKKYWWDDFCRSYGTDGCDDQWLLPEYIINPDIFADIIYKFLKGELKNGIN